MAYVTNGDVQARLGTAAYLQLTDDDGNGAADAAVIDEARLGAEGEMNAHLARRFAVPIDTAAHPELAGALKSVGLDLIEYRLRGRRPPVPPNVTRRRDEAVAWLRGVADGSIELPTTGSPAGHPSRGASALASSEPRLLSRDELKAI